MNGNQAPYAIYLILWAVLVASALFSRRLPVGKLVRMAMIWVAIFATAYLLFEVFRT